MIAAQSQGPRITDLSFMNELVLPAMFSLYIIIIIILFNIGIKI